MSDFMPDDVLVKILAGLPAKSLVRFTCVCKSWQSLITSSNFITTHLNVQTKLSNNNDNSSRLILIRYCPRLSYNDRASLHVDNDTFDLCEKLHFPSFFEPNVPFRVLGSCNGLMLLSTVYMTPPLMLWNPSIRKSLIIRFPRVMYNRLCQDFGFGFDSRTNDYKLVRLVYHRSKGNVVDVYKLSTRSWKTITVTFDLSYFPTHRNYWGGLFINGAVHWTVSKMGSFLIMSFNMSYEDFHYIMPPANLQGKFDFDVAACGEWLSLFNILNDRYCSLWVMKEYGVVESWTKLYTVDLNGELEMPLGFRKNRELVLAKTNGELVSYDSETQQLKYLGHSHLCLDYCLYYCMPAFNVYTYMESLVLLGDARRFRQSSRKKRKSRRFHQS